MNLADNLKRIRKDNNLSQEQLAEKLGVSRQSVSKWESGLSYPEMDKVLQICNLFNLNINELINENIKDANEMKEAQIRSNKYISSFFEYVTKTVDMFSSMKFKEKVKCLFEQGIVSLILFVILAIIGLIFSELVSSILRLLPDMVYYPLYSIFKTLYIVLGLVVGSVILFHIFKIRYLDYYEIVKDDNDIEVDLKSNIDNIDEKDNKIFLEKKKEKIVIRDPKHSEYKFFTGVGKLLLWIVKLLACFLLACFALTLVVFVVCIPISFLVVPSGLLFVGLLLSIIGGILINIIILEIIYSFVVSRRWNKVRIFIVSLMSLVLFGFGVGLTCVSATKFNFENKTYDVTETIFEYEMTDKLFFRDWNFYDDNIDYIEKDINNIEIVVKHSDLYVANLWNDGNAISMYVYTNDSNLMKYVRAIINDINHKIIGNYDYQVEIYVYANKGNIEKLKKNKSEYDSRINDLENELNEARVSYREVSTELDSLREVIFNSDLEVVTDNNGVIIDIKEKNEEIE